MGSSSLSTYKSSSSRYGSRPLEDSFGKGQFVFSFRPFITSLHTNGRTVLLIRIENGFGNANGDRFLTSRSRGRCVWRGVIALLRDVGKSRGRNTRGRSDGSRSVAVTDLFTQRIDLSIDLVDLSLLLQQFVLQFLHPIGPSDELDPVPLDLSFEFEDTLFLTLQGGQMTLKGVFQLAVPFLHIGTAQPDLPIEVSGNSNQEGVARTLTLARSSKSNSHKRSPTAAEYLIALVEASQGRSDRGWSTAPIWMSWNRVDSW
jgi:hypothetical protein